MVFAIPSELGRLSSAARASAAGVPDGGGGPAFAFEVARAGPTASLEGRGAFTLAGTIESAPPGGTVGGAVPGPSPPSTTDLGGTPAATGVTLPHSRGHPQARLRAQQRALWCAAAQGPESPLIGRCAPGGHPRVSSYGKAHQSNQ